MFTGLIRTIILYILIIAGIRLMGKRQVGELEPSELVLSLIIADLASVPMQDLGIPLHAGVVPILALLSLTMILSVLTMKSIRFRALLCGRPSVVIRRGEIDQREMRRNRLTVDELLDELLSSKEELLESSEETSESSSLGISTTSPTTDPRAEETRSAGLRTSTESVAKYALVVSAKTDRVSAIRQARIFLSNQNSSFQAGYDYGL